MTSKILFWINNFYLNFGIANQLQNIPDFELYAIYETTEKPSSFFKSQKIVNFKKTWFFFDNISKVNKNIDFTYLKKIESNYSINLWKLAINERIFYNYNDFYRFKDHEILKILENECKFFEKILDEINPDYLLIHETALHFQQLFYEICKKKGIKVLMLNQSKLGYRCTISQNLHQIDNCPKLESIQSKNRTFDDLINYINKFDSAKQTKNYNNNLGKSKIKKIKALLEFILSGKNNKNNFTYFGRSKFKVIFKIILLMILKYFRKSFLDKYSHKSIPCNEKFILFTLNQDPERSTLIAAPFYSNQFEVIRHIAKSIPIDYKLYVKEHFSQSLREWRKISTYKKIIQIPNVRLFHPSSDTIELIKKSSLVISIGGTPPFQAVFYKKPSLVFADIGFTIIPSIKKISCLEELPSLIVESLSENIISDDLDKYMTILENNTFDFDLIQYQIDENVFFKFDGSNLDAKIDEKKMEKFLTDKSVLFENLSKQYIKKIKNLDGNNG